MFYTSCNTFMESLLVCPFRLSRPLQGQGPRALERTREVGSYITVPDHVKLIARGHKDFANICAFPLIPLS